MPRSWTRRSALKSTAAASVAFWMGSLPECRSETAPNNRLNIAFIGVGGRGATNLKELSSQNIVALCDVDEVRAGKAFDEFPKAKKFTDYRKMLEQLESQIDAVVVSTPDHTHYHPSMMALHMGKHLYCEKPMAHSVWEVREMTKLAARMNVATQLGVQRHALPNVHRTVELIQAGTIGEVREVHAWVNGDRGMPDPPKTGEPVPATLDWDLWLGPAADREYAPDYCPYNWRFWWDFGTGETGNWGCHILDIPFAALGLTTPGRIDAMGPDVDPLRSPRQMTTKLQFPQQDVTLHWYHAKHGPPILQDNGIEADGMNTLFIGSKGMLLTGFDDYRLLPEERFQEAKAPPKTIPDSPGFHEEWITACKGGAPATCHFSYSGPLTETVLLANTAYRAGGFDWDATRLSTGGNSTAGDYIRTEYRAGWEV